LITLLILDKETFKMKVLKKAKGGWSIEVLCSGFGNGGKGCGSLLQVKKKDLVYWPGVPGDSWGSRDPAVSFKCKVCDTRSDIGKADWPQNYRNLTNVSSSWYKDTENQDSGEK
jgi:hypothetical protein